MDNNLDLQYALDADIETAFDSFVDAIYDEVMNDVRLFCALSFRQRYGCRSFIKKVKTVQDNGQCLYRGKEVGL